MLKMINANVAAVAATIVANACVAEPSAICMSRCELGQLCDQIEFEEYPDFAAALAEFPARCSAGIRYAIEGVCGNDRNVIVTGNGFTSEMRLYATTGEFEGLITQSDAVSPPCMGQTYWPQYLQCESATVTNNLCGDLFEVGTPAFEDRWE